MNSIPYSNSTAALLCVVGLVAFAGTAAAFSVSTDGSVPSETAVDSEVSATYVIDDPFTGVAGEYTLTGATELRDVSWTVSVLRAGSTVSQETYGDQSFSQDLDIDNNGDQVRIELVGTAPTIGNYTYQPEERYTLASLARITGSNEDEFRNDTAHHYTDDSRTARQAIDAAQEAVDDAPGDTADAQAQIDRAISAYLAEDFDNAVSLAEDAQQQAQQNQQSQQTTRTLLYAGGAVVLLLVLAGGGYLFYQSRQDDYSKL